ncbi:MAG: FkbM family methyltransferase [Desulfarculales bacterium]|nr:FkbM family methyltransferase [Desulfarculales bacterium]
MNGEIFNVDKGIKMNEILSLLHAIHYSYVDPALSNGATELAKAFIKLQSIIKPKASLEIGAHDADFSKKLKKTRPEIDVIAYEGSKTVYTAITKQIDFEKLEVKYCYGVVSDTDGTVVFREMFDAQTGEPAVSFVSSLLARQDMTFLDENKYVEKDVTVPSMRGDTILSGYGDDANICVWIDVEGANRQVLKGLEGALRSGKLGSLYIEVEQRNIWQAQWLDRDVYEYMTSLGYFLLARDCQHHAQYNMLFVRNDLMSNQFFDIIGQEYGALSKTSDINIRCVDFWNALQIAKGQSFIIGRHSYTFSESPNPRVKDLYSSHLPPECCYSIVFTGMHSIDIRLCIIHPNIPFEHSGLRKFDDQRVLAELEEKLLERCMINSYQITIGQKTEYGFLALSLPYTSLMVSYYLNILTSFIEITRAFLDQEKTPFGNTKPVSQLFIPCRNSEKKHSMLNELLRKPLRSIYRAYAIREKRLVAETVSDVLESYYFKKK